MSADMLASLFGAALMAGAPLALAALGGLYTASAGSLSVALEGSMLVGAFAAASIAQATGSFELGMIAGAMAGLLISSLVASAAILLRADVFVAGLAANLLAPGAVSAISQAAFGTKGVLPADVLAVGARFPAGPEPGFSGFGSAFFIVITASALLALTHSKSVFGLRLRASGEEGEAARAALLDPNRYRFASHLVSGAASGLAGAYLACGVSAFVPGMSSGRGWIALAAIYLGGKRPLGIALSCALFGSLFALSNLAQGIEGAAAANSELLLSIPYIASAAAFVLWKRYGDSSSGAGDRTIAARRIRR